MGKQKHNNKSTEEHGGNLLPFLIMLATIAAVAIPMIWLNLANPVNRYNAHLQKAEAIYATAQRSAGMEATSVDPMQAAAAYREFATALKYGERAFGHDDPRLEDVLLALLIFSIDTKEWSQAKRHGERLLKMQQARYPEQDKRFAVTHGYLAQVYHELDESAAEERMLKELVALDAGFAARRGLAQFYQRRRRPAEALPLYRQVVAGDMIEVAKAEKSGDQAKYRKSLETTAADTDEYLKVLSALKKTDESRNVTAARDKIRGKLGVMQNER
ncbi:MAG: tetratricopeptide repeat protein [Armatimonadota bacterium]